MARNTDAMKRGWNYDPVNGVLSLMVNGTEVAKFSTTVATLVIAPTVSNDMTIASGKKIQGAGTGANGIVLKNLKYAATSSLSGTQKDIEIDIGGVAYYFTCYPTKA